MPVSIPYGAGGGNPVTREQAGLRPLPEAPAGYTRDPNTGALIPLAGSPTDVLAQRERQQRLEDEARQRQVSYEFADRQAREQLRGKLIGMLDRPEQISSSTGYGYGAGIGRPIEFPTATFAGGGGGPAAPPPPTIGRIELPDTSAAQANLFARAKDKVAAASQGSLASLRSALAGRGMLGGGAEARGAQNVMTAGLGQLGDVAREQAIQEGQRLTDFAKLGYEGAINQRGQDITARGQDIQKQESDRDAALRAALGNYEGQISQRGQDVTARGQDIAARTQANTQRNASVTNLLGRLY